MVPDSDGGKLGASFEKKGRDEPGCECEGEWYFLEEATEGTARLQSEKQLNLFEN